MRPLFAVTALLMGATAATAATFTEVDGIVSMEAEKATARSGWKEVKGLPNSSGSTMQDEGGALDFSIRFSQRGRYVVWFLHQKPKGAGDKKNDCHASFNGDKLFVFEGEGGRPIGMGTHKETLAWESRPKTHHAPDRSRHVFLLVDAPGTYTFSVRSRSRGYLVDKVCLKHESRPDAHTAPSGNGPRETAGGPQIEGVEGLPGAARLVRAGYLGRALASADSNARATGETGELARTVAAALRAHATTRLSVIAETTGRDPARAVQQLRGLARAYSGSDVGRKLSDVARTWLREPAVKDALQAEAMLAQVETEAWRVAASGKKNQRARLARFTTVLEYLKKRFPDTPACARAVALGKELGIE